MSDDLARVDARGSDDGSPVAGALVVLVRIIQVALAAFAVVVVVGSLAAGMNVIAFAAMGVLALVLLGFVAVLEFVARGLKGWSG